MALGVVADRGGAIPARAEEAFRSTLLASPTRVHPRACGGNEVLCGQCSIEEGPSPRVRGKPRGRPGEAARMGSIPARAGETVAGGRGARPEAVHPRACGGNNTSTVVSCSGSGPSPRVRGKPWRRGTTKRRRRSIPARAGETVRPRARRSTPGVHPRACGGNPMNANSVRASSGPSPRVRGNTITSTGPMRGAGPSPRVRGKRFHRHNNCAARGSIPARAGETRSSSPRKPLTSGRVHPRACGGNGVAARRVHPRACGGKGEASRGHRGGSIPARAGETAYKTR